MLKVIFKDVGQGDSIIIEWQNDDEEDKIGIIDSNQHNGNPVLDYIKQRKTKEIEFIVLSHPHSDHFSGLLEILEYCKENLIEINNFIHTCKTHKSFIKSCTITSYHRLQLINIFKFIDDYKTSH